MGRKAHEFAILKRADDLVDQLRRLVPMTVKQWDETAIHDARVATRRLRAMVDVMAPIISASHRKEFGRVLRRLRRRLGPLRDMDVLLGHLQHMPGRTVAAQEWISARLEQRQTDLRETAKRKIAPPKVFGRLGAWWGVREEIAANQEAVDTLLSVSLKEQLEAFVRRANALVGDKPVDPGDDPATNDPHALRVAGKNLRYGLEMAAAQGHKLPAAVMRSFKQMQDALGLWHDYVVLAECVLEMSLEESLAHHDSAMQGNVIEMAKIAVGRSARQLARFSELWTERGQKLAEMIRGAFAVSEAPKPPDLFRSEETPPQADTPPSAISAA